MAKGFTLILACFNEGDTFEKSVFKIISELKKMRSPWEIIFIEDKSQDNTREQIEKIVKTHKNIRSIYHKKNLGRGASVSEGIGASRYPICGYMDVDCEVSPTYLHLFIEEIKKGADLAVGTRFYEKGISSLGRVVASKVYSSLVRVLLDLPVDDTETGFKFFNKNRISKVLKSTRDKGWFWDTEICARAYWQGLTIRQIPVLFIRRNEKKSTVNLFSDSFDYFVKLLKFRSQRPISN